MGVLEDEGRFIARQVVREWVASTPGLVLPDWIPTHEVFVVDSVRIAEAPAGA